MFRSHTATPRTPRTRAGSRLALLIGLLCGVTEVGAETESWSGYRGARGDGMASAATALGDVAASGLKVVWRSSIGSGYSGIAIADGRVYTMFADGEVDYLGAFAVDGGAELWRTEVGPLYAGHDGSHDGAIATPRVAGDRVCALSPRGRLFCATVETGEVLWETDLVEDHAGEKPWYGFSSSPLAVDGRLIVEFSVEEKSSVTAFDLESGKPAWSAGSDRVDYQSPMLLGVGDETHLLATGAERLYGVDPADGRIVWQYEHGGDGSPIGSGSMNPVPAGPGRLLLGYSDEGAKMVRVAPSAEGVGVEELWSTDAFRGTYATPVYHDGHLYGFTNRFLTCVSAETGGVVWRSRAPGDGFVTLVGDHLAIMTKKGTFHIAAASPEGYTEISSQELFFDHSWTPVSVEGDALYARSFSELVRVELAGEPAFVGAAQVPKELDRSFFLMFVGGTMKAVDRDKAVDGLWNTVDQAPLREDDKGVHFVYREESAEDVALVSDLTGDRHAEPMNRIPGTHFYFYSAAVDPAARFDYHFVRNFTEEIPDPLNERSFEVDGNTRSWYAMPEWDEPEFLGQAVERTGRVVRLEVEYADYAEDAPVDVYVPNGYDQGDDRYPVAYVHGGAAAIERGELVAALDWLIEADRIEPLIAVFIHAPKDDPESEEPPKVQMERYAKAISGDLVRRIDESFRTRADAESRASVGAGWDGFRALYTGFEHADLFGGLGLQSVYMLTSQEEILDEVLSEASEKPFDLYLEWGMYDRRSEVEGWDMIESSRRLDSRLRELGYEAAGGEVPDGSGWNSWKNRTGDVYGTLFPGSSPRVREARAPAEAKPEDSWIPE